MTYFVQRGEVHIWVSAFDRTE